MPRGNPFPPSTRPSKRKAKSTPAAKLKPVAKPRPINRQSTPDTHRTQEAPDALAKVNALKRDQAILDFVTGIRLEIEHAGTDRVAWEENTTRWFKKRYGIRPAVKNFPFPNASNTHIFLTEETIRRIKPNYLNLAFEGDPLCLFEPYGGTPVENAMNAEVHMDWLLRHHMDRAPGLNYIRALSIVVDLFLEKGFAFAKTTYEHQFRSYTETIDIDDLPEDIRLFITNSQTSTDEIAQLVADLTGMSLENPSQSDRIRAAVAEFKAGKDRVRLRVDATLYRGPRVSPIDPADLFVPPDTTDIETWRFGVHRMGMTLNELRGGEKAGKYHKDAVDQVAANPGTKREDMFSTLKQTKASREGVTEYLASSSVLEIWEIYTWYDIDGDGVEEKVVITYHPSSQAILRVIEYPYRHGQWPVTRFEYELSDVRWYSPRGVPAFLDHYQTNATNLENAKQDYMTLANSLQYKYRTGSMNPGQIQWILGQGIAVNRMEDMEVFQMPRLDVSFDTELEKQRSLAKELIGQPDLAMAGMQQQQERRTAFEVSEMVSMAKQIFSLDARLFKASLQRMYYQIFALEMQYGPDEYWIRTTGSPKPVATPKEQLEGDYAILPNGEFSLLARTLEVDRARQIVELAIKDQSGAIDPYEAWQNYFLKFDPRASKRVLAKREVYQQIQQMQMQMKQAEITQKLALAGRIPATGGNGAAAGPSGSSPGASQGPTGTPKTASNKQMASAQ